MPRLTAFLGQILNPVSSSRMEFMKDGALVVNHQGTIVEYGKKTSALRKSNVEIVDFGRSIIIPGLIDLHAHLPQMGIAGFDVGDIWSWLENYAYPAEIEFMNPSTARKVSDRFFTECKSNGTTTTCVNLGVDSDSAKIAFEKARTSGLRVIMGKMMMDRRMPRELCEKTKNSIAESESLCKRWHRTSGGRILYSFNPRSASCCSKELLGAVSKLAKKYGAHIQTHMSESLDEISWARDLHPSFTNYGEFYQRHSILGPRSIAAHGIHLSGSELRLLAGTETSIAHCPSSNLLLRSGMMDVLKGLAHGISLGLGSDVGAGPTVSLLHEMRMACYTSRARTLASQGRRKSRKYVDSKLAFYLATLGAARALGMDARLGSFARGKESDFAVLQSANLLDKRTKASEVVAEVVFRACTRMILATAVGGKIVYERDLST